MIFKKKEYFLLIFLILLQSCSGGRIGNFLESSFNDLEKISQDEGFQKNLKSKNSNNARRFTQATKIAALQYLLLSLIV